MAVIRICDICESRIYSNTKFYTLDYGSETDKKHGEEPYSVDRVIHMEICSNCFKTIIDACKNKEAKDDN